MKTIRVKRFLNAPDDNGTFGFISIDGFDDRWFSMERPWKENKPNVSCIPLGTYEARHGTFAAGGGYPDLELVHVPARKFIEIHAANYANQLKGCIAPGTTFSMSDWSLRNSRKALRDILKVIGGDQDIEVVVSMLHGG